VGGGGGGVGGWGGGGVGGTRARSLSPSFPSLPSHLQALGDEGAGGAQHGPPGVQQLVGAVLLDLLDGLAQAQGVVAVAAWRERGEGGGRSTVSGGWARSRCVGKASASAARRPPFTTHWARGALQISQVTALEGQVEGTGCPRLLEGPPTKIERAGAGNWVGRAGPWRAGSSSRALSPSTLQNSLAGQGAVQVGGHLGRVQQAAGQVQPAVRACKGRERERKGARR